MNHDPGREALSPDLDALPTIGDRRLAVRVTPDALRQMRGGHPWIYDRSIVSISDGGSSGDLAVVFDRRRRFAGIGLFDPDSPIRLKMLHVGKPIIIDSAWLRERIDVALQLRGSFVDGPPDGAYRIVSGENDGLPGLVVDRYANVLVVKLYSAAWWPWLKTVTEVLLERTGATGIVLRLARMLDDGAGRLGDGSVIAGAVADGPVLFTENGLRFEADVRRGQKTGHFLDQRGNRIAVGAMAGGRDVLDAFAATGGFGVHAAAGGARRVHSVDVSAPTLAAATRNMALNAELAAVAACRHSTEVGDAFEVFARLAAKGESFDIVVIDPPSFAQRQDRADAALRAYAKLTSLACRLIRPGGVLVQASCSSRITVDQFHAVVTSTAAIDGVELHEIMRSGHEPDHPIGFPEGAYLKAGFWTVGRRR